MGVVVQIDSGREPVELLKPILDLVREDMESVNRIILDKAISDVDLIPKLAHHLIDFGRQAPEADADDCCGEAR